MNVDPIDIQNCMGGDTTRVKKRKELINQFLSWMHKNRETFNKNNEERLIIRQHISFWYGMKASAALFSMIFYGIFLRGIYVFRSHEVLNMAKIPNPIRIGVAWTVGFTLYRNVYKYHIYNRDLYSLAVKYREFYN